MNDRFMDAFVIAIESNVKSMAVAERCIKTGSKFGLDVKVHPAVTPKDDIDKMMME